MLWYAKLKDILHVGDGAVVKLWRFDPAKIMEKGKPYDDGLLGSRISKELNLSIPSFIIPSFTKQLMDAYELELGYLVIVLREVY